MGKMIQHGVCILAALILHGCGGGGGGGGGAVGGTSTGGSAGTTYTSAAMAGELLTYSVDTTNLTYSYTITDSQYGLNGKTGSGTLINNGNGTYSPSGISNAKIAVLPNGLLLGAIRETLNGTLTTIPIIGMSNPVTTLVTSTFNYVQRSCISGSCSSRYGTFQVTASGTWASCPSGNLTTGCPGTTNSGTLNSLGGGKWQVLDNTATNIGTAIVLNSGGQQVVFLDLKDVRIGGFGIGLIVGSSQQSVTTAQTDGTWASASTSGNHAIFSASGSNVNYLTVNGVPNAATTTFTANSPWAGFVTTATGGHALLAGTGMYAEQNASGYAEIGIKITTPVTPTVQQYAYGIWDGAFSSTPVKMVVLPNGGFFQWFGTAAPLGQLHGSLAVNTSNQLGFSSSYGMLNGLYEQNWYISTSSIVTASTLSFTASGGVVSNPWATPRSYSLAFNNSYNSPFTNADLTGNYSGISMGQSSTFSINSSGVLTGLNGGCSLNGTISPDVSKGYALVSMTLSGVNCGANMGSNIGYLIKSGTGIGQQIWIGLFSGIAATPGYGYSIVGAKQ